jgi:hypothetical protein
MNQIDDGFFMARSLFFLPTLLLSIMPFAHHISPSLYPPLTSSTTTTITTTIIISGAGALRVDPVYGGIVVAEVQANLGTHGVTVESTPDERFYQVHM